MEPQNRKGSEVMEDPNALVHAAELIIAFCAGGMVTFIGLISIGRQKQAETNALTIELMEERNDIGRRGNTIIETTMNHLQEILLVTRKGSEN